MAREHFAARAWNLAEAVDDERSPLAPMLSCPASTRSPSMRRPVLLALAAALAVASAIALAKTPEKPPRGPFGLSLLSTPDGKPSTLVDFESNGHCGMCHQRQQEEMAGSLHSIAHVDRFYRLFAELARAEAGDEMYALCSGCHTPAAVASNLIPAVPEEKLPALAKAGVTCDVCHSISKLTGDTAGWGEPGNASFVLEPGYVKFGAADDISTSPTHDGARRAFYETSDYCATCHTIIHPTNGLRIEHTYAEWKKSVYAEKGIHCQDCHMRSPEEARTVARTLRPVVKKGTWVRMGQEREIAAHLFAGANVNAHRLGGGERHAALAREMLKGAAKLEIREAEGRAFEVAVKNVGAGHSLPTSLTEIREMWVELTVTDASGAVVLRSGVLDEAGEIPEGSIRFGAIMEDALGNPTVKPWEGVRFRVKRLVPPRGEDVTRVDLPETAKGDLTVKARLLYRSASPRVVRMVMKDEAFPMEIVEMATARRVVTIR
jgi:hypothetical protein